jgi:hypothetical protein
MDDANAFLHHAKLRLVRAFWFTLALIFLVETWIWDHVRDWLRKLAVALGVERLEPWLESVVAKLSPPATLALFAVPVVAILPLKIAGLAILASGHFFWGLVFILLVKSLALGVEAFLFDICRDKLLQMEWFARFHALVLRVRAWASALVWPYKMRIAALVRTLREKAAALLGGEGEIGRRIARLREAVRARSRA